MGSKSESRQTQTTHQTHYDDRDSVSVTGGVGVAGVDGNVSVYVKEETLDDDVARYALEAVDEVVSHTSNVVERVTNESFDLGREAIHTVSETNKDIGELAERVVYHGFNFADEYGEKLSDISEGAIQTLADNQNSSLSLVKQLASGFADVLEGQSAQSTAAIKSLANADLAVSETSHKTALYIAGIVAAVLVLTGGKLFK